VGGGWAGIAAAVALTDAGRQVTLFEAAPRLGGRARTLPWAGLEVDNGQHLLIGAYRETLSLMRRCGIDERTLLRRPLRLHMMGARPLRLTTPPLPAPLHLATALFTAHGLRSDERQAALRLCLRMAAGRFRLRRECTVASYLAAHRQPPELIERLWGPLCLGAMNTPPEQASARCFLRVLRDTFARRRSDSDLIFPRRPLGELLPERARHHITAAGGTVRTGDRVEGLQQENGRITTIATRSGRHSVDAVVVALPPEGCRRLLAPLPPLAALAATLPRLTSAPITTLYLRYPPQVTLPEPMLGLTAGLTQWLFDRGQLCDQPGVMAAVISGGGAHMEYSREQLGAAVAAELAHLSPHWPAPEAIQVVRERRATLLCTPDAEALRPPPATPTDNLWLAGDWTATGYPATLEGAVRSGVQCAREICSGD